MRAFHQVRMPDQNQINQTYRKSKRTKEAPCDIAGSCILEQMNSPMVKRPPEIRRANRPLAIVLSSPGSNMMWKRCRKWVSWSLGACWTSHVRRVEHLKCLTWASCWSVCLWRCLALVLPPRRAVPFLGRSCLFSLLICELLPCLPQAPSLVRLHYWVLQSARWPIPV